MSSSGSVFGSFLEGSILWTTRGKPPVPSFSTRRWLRKSSSCERSRMFMILVGRHAPLRTGADAAAGGGMVWRVPATRGEGSVGRGSGGGECGGGAEERAWQWQEKSHTRRRSETDSDRVGLADSARGPPRLGITQTPGCAPPSPFIVTVPPAVRALLECPVASAAGLVQRACLQPCLRPCLRPPSAPATTAGHRCSPPGHRDQMRRANARTLRRGTASLPRLSPAPMARPRSLALRHPITQPPRSSRTAPASPRVAWHGRTYSSYSKGNSTSAEHACASAS